MKRALVIVLALFSAISVPLVGGTSPISAEGENSIRGIVRDSDGTPLAGIQYSTNPFFGFEVTGSDGSYLLTDQYPGFQVTITFIDPAGLHQQTTLDAVPSDTEAVVVDVVMPDSNPDVYGRVTDPDGNGVGGVRVRDITNFVTSAVTNPDGYYGLSGLFPGVQDFQAETFPNVPTLKRQTITGIDVQPGVPTEVNFSLTRFARVQVTVTAGGAPAADVDVTLWQDLLFDNPVGNLRTDSNGVATFSVFEDGDYYVQLYPTQPGYAAEYVPDTIDREQAARVTVTGDELEVVTAELEAQAIISGVVLLPDGSPGSPWDVTAKPVGSPDNYFYPFACNLPDENDPPGTFRIGCLHPSVDYVVKAFGIGQADNEYYEDSESAVNATPIAVEEGQTVSGLVIQLDPKTPEPTFTGMSKTYFVTGTTTPGVRLYGSNFPTDPNALEIQVQSWFGSADITVTVTSIVNSGEAIATVTLDPADVGSEPQARELFLNRSTGGFASCTCRLFYGDATTPVGTISGRVTDNKNKPVANSVVQVRWPEPFYPGGYASRTFVTGPDGRWTGDGLVPRTYQVVFVGSETLAGEYWNDKHNAANATNIVLAAGQTKSNVNAQLDKRGTIAVSKVTPRFQSRQLEFDVVGTGLSPIVGDFQVFVDFNGNLSQMQVTNVSDTKLHAVGFGYLNGTFDVVTRWTGADGSPREARCVGCISSYDELLIFRGYDTNVPRGSTTTVFFDGSGLADLTKIQVSGTGVSAVSWVAYPEFGGLEVVFTAKPNAAIGERTVTITRKDGSTTTTVINIT